MDDAADEFGTPDDAGIYDRIGTGQYYEADEIYGLVLAQLERRAEEIEDA